MNSARVRQILLWGFPVLIVSVFVFFFIADKVVKPIDRSYQEARQALGDWTILDRDCSSILLDNSGKVWAGGERYQNECGDGLYVFDDTQRVDVKYQYLIDDFAVDLAGQVWVIPEWQGEPLISVYDGKAWKTYTYQDMGLLSDRYSTSNIELDSKGTLWVEIFNFEENIRELLVFENNSWKLLSSEDTGLPANDEYFNMTSDPEGRLWLAYPYRSLKTDDFTLYVFDGIRSHQILYAGERLRDVSDIAFDQQNHLWVVDRCGNVGEFTDLSETYPKEITAPELQHASTCNGGSELYIDAQERIWLWDSGRIRMFENETWLTLTFDNSGLAGDHSIYGLVVDDLDRAWILSDKAIHMIPVKDIQTLPQETVDRWRRAMSLGDLLDENGTLLLIELGLLWGMVLLNLNVRQGIRVTAIDTETIRQIKRLASQSLAFGNLSYGTPCLLMLLAIVLIPELLVYIVIPLSFLAVIVSSLVSLATAASAIRSLKKEGLDNNDTLKKTVSRGIILNILGIAILILAIFYIQGYWGSYGY